MRAPAKQQTPFEYWISFWPTAPLFGVKWRFENLAPGFPFFRPTEVMAQMTVASAREIALATGEHAEAAVVAVEQAVDAAQVMAAAAAVAVQAEPVEEAAPVERAEPAEPLAPAVEETGPMRPALLYDTAPVDADDLKQIKGVGPKLESMLNAMGIYRFDQIAAMSDGNLQWIDDNLTAFKGRPFRDDWVAQARSLV